MWKYEKPEMEVVDFEAENIATTGVVEGSNFGEDNENPWYGPSTNSLSL